MFKNEMVHHLFLGSQGWIALSSFRTVGAKKFQNEILHQDVFGEVRAG